MSDESSRHERVRFRREDIVDLGALPSAGGRDLRLARPRKPRRGRRWLKAASLAAVALVLALATAVYLVGVTGFGREELRREAERALERVVGRDLVAAIGSARLSFDGSRLVSLEVSDVSLRAAGDGGRWIEAGAVRFGIQLVPLLSGDLALGSATLADARIVAKPPWASSGGDWTAAFRDERGLVDPGRAPALVFDALQRTFAALERDALGTFTLSNVSVVLPGSTAQLLVIEEAELASSDRTLSVTAVGTVTGRRWTAEGGAERSGAGSESFSLRVASSAGEGADAGPVHVGDVALLFTGSRPAGGPARLSARLQASGARLVRDRLDPLAGDVEVAVTAAEGSRAIAIEQLAAVSGASVIRLAGEAGPEETGTSYRWSLGGKNIALASAAASGEPAVLKEGRAAGRFDPAAMRLSADEFTVTGGDGGRASGSAELLFASGRSPGAMVSLDVGGLSVETAKTLWPWTAARGARQWALAHLHGGRVGTGRLVLDVAPGRIGAGVPFTANEVFGDFTVSGTRFDVWGDIPPVRDAAGSVAFRGRDAEVALAAGAMDLPGGGSLAASNGRFTIRGGERPLIGKLAVGVEGPAAAMAELASLDPINAGSRLPIAPAELDGAAKAEVAADIPLQRGIPGSSLGWRVALAYENLAVARPFEGQLVTEAKGTAVVEPAKASIDATAKLNGAPAKLALVEPLRPDGPARERRIELTLDDKAREALAPGLSGLVSGPVRLAIDASDDTREVEADLDAAKLALPWIGWSKGGGVAARSTFTLAGEGDGTAISDFTLEGKSFSARGSMLLADGGLSSARFDRVRLNRGDSIAVALRRTGNGFTAKVSGKSLDARALVKQVTGGAGDTPARPRGKGPKVSVEAAIDRVSGFHGESLSDVTLSYSTGGAGGAGSLTLDAATASGGSVALRDATGKAGRRLELRATDAGAVLRFLDVYEKVQGGVIDVALASAGENTLAGRIAARDFAVENEERLGSLVSRGSTDGGRSLNDVVREEIDTSRVSFSRASAAITKGEKSLSIREGVLRGPVIGATFQGTVTDARGRMDMTGTFMPAYGLNRIFGELPLVGAILGNGRDRGLIGVTFKLEGDAKAPVLTVNPLSVIAPGIFRQIFEYD